MRCVAPHLPVVGGFADLSSEEIAQAKAIGYPLSDDMIKKGDIVCNHLWKAQGPAGQGQFFCPGWLSRRSCAPQRDPKLDKLDCGFHFDAEQVKRKEAMHLNLAWDRRSSWGLYGMTKHQIDSRAMYYRGMTNENPAWDIIRSLRSAPITLEHYPHDKRITAPPELIEWGVPSALMDNESTGSNSGDSRAYCASVGPRLQTPPPSPEKKRKLAVTEFAGSSNPRGRR